MDSGRINVSTGPVRISAAVRAALQADPVSHRSPSFLQDFSGATHLLCDSFQVRNAYLLSGSGTLANEAMLQQVKLTGGKGLILSNGEFGTRLINQAERIGLSFATYTLPWGTCFDLADINTVMQQGQPSWMVFVHCETSTGIMNDLEGLLHIGRLHQCLCFADCMSTVGTRPIDLSGLAMATASSGKGLASIPGLAIVLSNMEHQPSAAIPSYFDLGLYAYKGGIPFTISSNQVGALSASLKEKLAGDHYCLLERYRKKISALLKESMLTPFNQGDSFVFTLVPPRDAYAGLIHQLSQSGMILSYESDYLRKRGWIQIALFNYYREEELQQVVRSLKNCCTLPADRSLRE